MQPQYGSYLCWGHLCTPPCRHTGWLLQLQLHCLFHLAQRTQCPFLPRDKAKPGVVAPFPLSFSPSDMCLDLCSISAQKWLSLCITLFQVAFLDAVKTCFKWQFSKVLQGPCDYIHVRRMAAYHAVPPEGLLNTHIQQWFLLLTFRQISLESLHDMV